MDMEGDRWEMAAILPQKCKKPTLWSAFQYSVKPNYLAAASEAAEAAGASTAAEAAEASAAGAEASTAGAEASTTAEAASTGSSFLPQADKATANKAATSRDCFILKSFKIKFD
ncbi:hypothetical protein HQ393_06815 [Chitinibacter bivalviorum]|uniref:Uncharacterized protein n=1 Tax=Chitinibacter bivalviorum TaxID=2739434 RepID=A0A7H9BKI0_9NEIS|nr:hypothetical protein [Chitinibacter bivalviorum]QLG87994.1 hypothetical protein HQ393_06815 [Chitinibacter bivalviorum]